MLRLKDPILIERPSPHGIELPVLHEPDSLEMASPYAPSTVASVLTSGDLAEARSAALPPVPRFDRFGELRSSIGRPFEKPVRVDDRMVLKAVKHKRSFNWAGSRSALPAIVRQMRKYGWAVTVRKESLLGHA
jgi:hypothetical protein